MRRVSAGLALALIVGSGMTAAASSPSIRARINSIEQATVHIRGLKPLQPVKVEIQTKSAFDASYRAEVTSSITDQEIEVDRRELVLLGLLRPTDDLRSILLNTSAAQVLGFYDYHTKVLYVRSDSNRVLGPERYTIAHEYTHALQDQHYHLATLLPDQWPISYRNSDAVAAHHALTEGDAVNLQNLFIARTYSRHDLQALLKLQTQPDSSPKLPTALSRELYFPYTVGVGFVDAIYKNGGMKAIDKAYHRLPKSTFEIMHPAAYLAHWKPVAVTMHAVQGLLDWQQVDDDVLGAYGYDLLIWQFLAKKKADSVVNGYRGDRYIFLEKGDANAMLFKSVWKNPRAAKLANDDLVLALKHRLPNGRVTGPEKSRLVVGINVAVAFSLRGKSLTMAYGPTASTAEQLAAAPTS